MSPCFKDLYWPFLGAIWLSYCSPFFCHHSGPWCSPWHIGAQKRYVELVSNLNLILNIYNGHHGDGNMRWNQAYAILKI